MHDKFEWPEPDHEADEIIFRNVREHGCHVMGIIDADPAFSFSIGLHLNYGRRRCLEVARMSAAICGRPSIPDVASLIRATCPATFSVHMSNSN